MEEGEYYETWFGSIVRIKPHGHFEVLKVGPMSEWEVGYISQFRLVGYASQRHVPSGWTKIQYKSEGFKRLYNKLNDRDA